MTLARFSIASLALTLAMANQAQAGSPQPTPNDENIAIEDLLKSGWEVAGFTGTFDNRSAMILFRHPTETSLVQCLAGYDVTRTPRTYRNCYRLR